MTVSERSKSPDFFEDHVLDPVVAATGSRPPASAPKAKKKAGFYLSEELIERFNRRYHQLKLEGAAIENKSALLERALSFALDDLDKDEQSRLRAKLK
jgi:hypothetical protein